AGRLPGDRAGVARRRSAQGGRLGGQPPVLGAPRARQGYKLTDLLRKLPNEHRVDVIAIACISPQDAGSPAGGDRGGPAVDAGLWDADQGRGWGGDVGLRVVLAVGVLGGSHVSCIGACQRPLSLARSYRACTQSRAGAAVAL